MDATAAFLDKSRLPSELLDLRARADDFAPHVGPIAAYHYAIASELASSIDADALHHQSYVDPLDELNHDVSRVLVDSYFTQTPIKISVDFYALRCGGGGDDDDTKKIASICEDAARVDTPHDERSVTLRLAPSEPIALPLDFRYEIKASSGERVAYESGAIIGSTSPELSKPSDAAHVTDALYNASRHDDYHRIGLPISRLGLELRDGELSSLSISSTCDYDADPIVASRSPAPGSAVKVGAAAGYDGVVRRVPPAPTPAAATTDELRVALSTSMRGVLSEWPLSALVAVNETASSQQPVPLGELSHTLLCMSVLSWMTRVGEDPLLHLDNEEYLYAKLADSPVAKWLRSVYAQHEHRSLEGAVSPYPPQRGPTVRQLLLGTSGLPEAHIETHASVITRLNALHRDLAVSNARVLGDVDDDEGDGDEDDALMHAANEERFAEMLAKHVRLTRDPNSLPTVRPSYMETALLSMLVVRLSGEKTPEAAINAAVTHALRESGDHGPEPSLWWSPRLSEDGERIEPSYGTSLFSAARSGVATFSTLTRIAAMLLANQTQRSGFATVMTDVGVAFSPNDRSPFFRYPGLVRRLVLDKAFDVYFSVGRTRAVGQCAIFFSKRHGVWGAIALPDAAYSATAAGTHFPLPLLDGIVNALANVPLAENAPDLDPIPAPALARRHTTTLRDIAPSEPLVDQEEEEEELDDDDNDEEQEGADDDDEQKPSAPAPPPRPASWPTRTVQGRYVGTMADPATGHVTSLTVSDASDVHPALLRVDDGDDSGRKDDAPSVYIAYDAAAQRFREVMGTDNEALLGEPVYITPGTGMSFRGAFYRHESAEEPAIHAELRGAVERRLNATTGLMAGIGAPSNGDDLFESGLLQQLPADEKTPELVGAHYRRARHGPGRGRGRHRRGPWRRGPLTALGFGAGFLTGALLPRRHYHAGYPVDYPYGYYHYTNPPY